MKKLLILVFITPMTFYAQVAYFPLAKGNKWEFRELYSQKSTYYVVDDTVMSNSKIYSVLQVDSRDTLFQRQEGAIVYLYSSLMSQEYIWYDLSSNMGDTISRIPTGIDTMIITSSGMSWDTLFGSPRRCWRFYFDPRPNIYDDEWSFTVCDSIGIGSFVFSAGYYFEIIGAIVDGNVYGIITSIPAETRDLPRESTLNQNYPNPFNSTTNIGFTLTSGTNTSIAIHSLLGSKVYQVDLGYLEPGSHSVQIIPSSLTSGVYYYRLMTDMDVWVRSMVIIK
jgi:hypothetical protein